jgi:nucleolin
LKAPDGRSKGLAFVKFNDEDSLNTAIAKNNSDHMGRYLVIEKAWPRGA